MPRQCFFEKGYEKTTIMDIAQRTGVNRGSVVFAIKNKASLLCTLVGLVMESMFAGSGRIPGAAGAECAKPRATARLPYFLRASARPSSPGEDILFLRQNSGCVKAASLCLECLKSISYYVQ